MKNAAIFDGDIVVVDRAQLPANHSIIVTCLNGEFTIKRLSVKGEQVFLVPASPAYTGIQVSEEMEFQVWEVVTYCVHKVR